MHVVVLKWYVVAIIVICLRVLMTPAQRRHDQSKIIRGRRYPFAYRNSKVYF